MKIYLCTIISNVQLFNVNYFYIKIQINLIDPTTYRATASIADDSYVILPLFLEYVHGEYGQTVRRADWLCHF